MGRPCENPVWPCAMVGAASALAAVDGVGVVIHGSSACYFYADAVIPDPLNCTYLLEHEVVFGTEDRLREVVEGVSPLCEQVAVVNSCVPSTIGEDIRQFLDDHQAVVVDAPGYAGDLGEGFRRGVAALSPVVDPSRPGVNLDGCISTDLFSTGNRREAERLCAMAGIPVAACYCSDTLASVRHPAPVTISLVPDMATGIGKNAGALLGLSDVRDAFVRLSSLCPDADITPVMDEAEAAEERIIIACDRYLRVHDPPLVGVVAMAGYAGMIADLCTTYLDADIAFMASRTVPPENRRDIVYAPDIGSVRACLEGTTPDIIFGSAYEGALAPAAVQVQVTLPMKKSLMLVNRPLAGIEGALWVIERVLAAGLSSS
ncbi:hypothetical protein AZH53_07105 [Methanomicrobiaceae archaeon CYW5]|uniref:nitrogenase component 1 n=1 Tax=Methanovulcanius yangii TaxID=1789227 RepID=UPI0029CAA714|nr:nitrogenase component 1 [Methanovulcanius yangii]MBT8508171.1 hypothetical protein [Methanovulcanius yangii]